MAFNNRNALVIFSKPPELERREPTEPYAGLPWTDLDSLFFAMLDDLLETAVRLESVDIYILRFDHSFPDESISRFGARIQIIDLPRTTTNEAIQFSFETLFGKSYEYVLLLLEPHPLITLRDLQTALNMFQYDDDSAVIGQHQDGNFYLIGLKSNHSDLFISGEETRERPQFLLARLCEREVMMFPMLPKYSLDSGASLHKLKYDLEEIAGGNGFSKRTRTMFKILDKKYKVRRSR